MSQAMSGRNTLGVMLGFLSVPITLALTVAYNGTISPNVIAVTARLSSILKGVCLYAYH